MGECKCGAETIGAKRFCEACRVKRTAAHRKKFSEPRADKYVATEKLTPCRCPKCEHSHEMRLFWVGMIPALKFCPKCLATNSFISSSFA
jgi:hypothetical protein